MNKEYFKNIPSHIYYSNNKEYRECIRAFFQMNPNIYINISSEKPMNLEELMNVDPEIDDETMDECHYDMSAISNGMDYLYDETKDIPEFIKIYELASARMFCTDLSFGIGVLCSFDLFWLYYYVLYVFFNEGIEKMKESEEYNLIIGYFEKK